jgi:hypothetical protein
MAILIQNFVFFQLGWFACVLGAASQNYAWLGTGLVLLIVTGHVMRAPDKAQELTLILFVTFIGLFWDSALTVAGVYQFQSGTFIDGIAPHWLIAMWALFATTLNVSMRWLGARYVLAAVFGAMGGPLAYYAGHQLGAVDFHDPASALIIIGIGWSLIMPVLVLMTKFYNGYRSKASGSLEVRVYE